MDKLICTKCNTENDPKNLFCQSCGAILSAPAPSDSTVVASRPPAAVPPPVQQPVNPPVVPVTPPPPAYTPPVPVQQVPVAPTYAPPPAYGYPPSQMYMGSPIKDLGVQIDGWNDVIEDAAELAPRVKQLFTEKLNSQRLPGLRITDVSLTNNDIENRPYQLITNRPGESIAVRISPFGKNLVVSWDMYTKRAPNWLTIGLLAGIDFLIVLLYSIFGARFYGEFFTGLYFFLTTFIQWLVWPSLVLALIGKIVKDDWMALFVKDMNPFAADDAISMTTIVDNALSDAVEECIIETETETEPEVTPAVQKAKAKK